MKDTTALEAAIGELVDAAYTVERELGANAGMDEAHPAWQALVIASRRYAATFAPPQKTAAVGEFATNDARDAARYRFLRNGSHWPAVFGWHDDPEPLIGVELDAAIDGAMPKAKN
jgi:hypothetical protein